PCFLVSNPLHGGRLNGGRYQAPALSLWIMRSASLWSELRQLSRKPSNCFTPGCFKTVAKSDPVSHPNPKIPVRWLIILRVWGLIFRDIHFPVKAIRSVGIATNENAKLSVFVVQRFNNFSNFFPHVIHLQLILPSSHCDCQ